MLIPKKMFYAPDCRLSDDGSKPPTLRQVGVGRVVGRKINDACPYLGSYGMGGPGFVGFRLEKTAELPEEWLVLTLWGAAQWLRIDCHVLDCHRDHQAKYKAIFNEAGTAFSSHQEALQNLVVGCTIKEFNVQPRTFNMLLERENELQYLDLPPKLDQLAPYGNGKVRYWETDEELLDGFIVSSSEYINI